MLRAAVAAVAVGALTGCGTSTAPVTPLAASAAPAPVGGTSDFTDPERWATLPPFSRTEPVVLLEEADVAAAFPDDVGWEPGAITGTGGDWARAWCTGSSHLFYETGFDVPSPSDEHVRAWSVPSGTGSSPGLHVEAYRWGADVGAVTSAQRWGERLTASAEDCPGAEVQDSGGVPGEAPLVTATDAGGGWWEVQVATTGGPTAVRLRATVTAAAAGDAAEGLTHLAGRLVARLAVADDAASHLRDSPADRPDLSAAHLLSDDDVSRRDQPADPPAVATPVESAARSDGWCAESPVQGAPLPEQAWSTSWTEPGPFEPGFDVMEVDQRVLRFSGLGDEGGVAAAQAFSTAFRAGAQTCADAAADGREVQVSDYSVEGEDSLAVAVDQGDGTWRVTATARDGITVLVVSMRVQWEGEWYPDPVVALTGAAWARIREADRNAS